MTAWIKYIYCLFLFVFLMRPAFAQKKTDRNVHADTLLINEIMASGKRLHEQHQLDAAEEIYRKAYLFSKKSGNPRKTIAIIAAQNTTLHARSKYPQALKFARESLQISEALKDDQLIVEAYIRIGAQYFYMGDYKLATSNWMAGLKLAEQTHQELLQLKITSNLTAVFLMLQDKHKSQRYAKQSYQLAKTLGDTVSLAKALVNLSSSEGINGNFKNEEFYAQKAIELGYLMKDYSYIINIHLNLGVSFKKRRLFQTSLNHYIKAQELAKKYKNQEYDMSIYSALAEGLQNINRNEEALTNIRKSIPLAEAAGASGQLKMIYEIASNIYENLDNHKAAMLYLRKSNKIKDSLMNAETEAAINKMEREYELVKKEKALANQKLIISRNKLQLQEKNRYILIAIFTIVILITISVSFYIIYSSKNKAQQEKLKVIQQEKDIATLEAMISGEEKERSRLALNLHDGVGGILSVTKMHLDQLCAAHADLSASALYEKTVSMLDAASAETRAIAHNLAPQVLFQKGLNAAIGSFCNKANHENLNIHYYSIGTIKRYDTEFELFIYRTVQESFNNIVKHARASNVIVQLSINNDLLSLTIEDDGVGLDEALLSNGGIGLSNLKSRTIAKGGNFEITSSPGNGTSLYLEFDINPYKLGADAEKAEEYIIVNS